MAARRFGEVRTEDLGRLPARVVAGLLGEDVLSVGSEDEVCTGPLRAVLRL